MSTHAPAPTAIPVPPPELLPDRPTRILVADDEHLVATDLALTLGSLGVTVVGPVADGEAAMHMARLATPDLALLDIRMPKRDGLSAAREMFAELFIPVVILSAYSDHSHVQAAQEAGVFGYLIKPAREDQLRVCLDVVWRKFRAFAALQSDNQVLRRRLEDRKLIEQAKWILVSRKLLSEPDAMKTLQKRARDARRPLVEVARAVIEADTMLA
jgi:AmiR/NasT family two-component response regulator